MSKYPRIELQGTKPAIEADLQTLDDHFQDAYWALRNQPYRKVITPAEYDGDGEVVQEAVMSEEWHCNVILPVGHDFELETLQTKQ